MKTRLIPSLLLFVCVQALGWGSTAHRAAAGIAERYLSPEARLAIEDILERETLAEASTWPDFMRSAPSEFWQRTANPWHYVTVPEGKAYEEVGAPGQGDAYTALQGFSADLRAAETPPQDRALALRFIIHIIADLHQPLHVGNGTDRGGNDTRVTYFGQSTNLHRVWDSQLVDSEQLSYSEWIEWLDRKISREDFVAWRDPVHWCGLRKAPNCAVVSTPTSPIWPGITGIAGPAHSGSGSRRRACALLSTSTNCSRTSD